MLIRSIIGRIRIIIEFYLPSVWIFYQVLHCGLKTPNWGTSRTTPAAARSNRRLMHETIVLLSNICLINRFFSRCERSLLKKCESAYWKWPVMQITTRQMKLSIASLNKMAFSKTFKWTSNVTKGWNNDRSALYHRKRESDLKSRTAVPRTATAFQPTPTASVTCFSRRLFALSTRIWVMWSINSSLQVSNWFVIPRTEATWSQWKKNRLCVIR